MKKILIFFIFFPWLVSVQAQETLIFSTLQGVPTTGVLEKLLKEAYGLIGIQIQVAPFPAERALLLSNQGKVDGELVRAVVIEKSNPNLIRIPVSIWNLDLVVFTKDTSFEVDGWESLKPYRIGSQNGWKIVEANTINFQTTFITNPYQMWEMLDKNRLDIVVFGKFGGLSSLQKLEMSDIKFLPKSIMKLPLYHYIHRKHQSLVPGITASLKKMESNGRFQTLYDQYVARLK